MIGQVAPMTKWEEERIGNATASGITPLFEEATRPMTEEEKKNRPKKDNGKGGLIFENAGTTIIDHNLWTVGAWTYIDEKIAELTTNTFRKVENFSTDYGSQQEPLAISMLKVTYPNLTYYGKETQEFFRYSDFSGGSPDWAEFSLKLIGEIKCPENPANHIKYCRILTGDQLRKEKKEHWHQVQFNMLCVAKNMGWNYMETNGLFVSFCDLINFPFKKLHTIEILPNPRFEERAKFIINKYEKELSSQLKFLRQ